MANVIKVPETVKKRLIEKVPRYQKLLADAKAGGVNEDDTVTIVVDMLNEVFGFKKISEITQQYRIKNKKCDVAVKLGDEIQYLVEVKAIRTNPLKEDHIEQAVNYAAREKNTDWVILTNGIRWLVFRVLLKDEVRHEQVFDFDFMDVKPRNTKHQETLFMLCRRGVNKPKAPIEELYGRQQVVNKHKIAAVLMMSEEVHKIIARELKKLGQNTKPDKKEIAAIIAKQVISPDLVDDEETKKAMAKIKRMQNKQDKLAKEKAAAAQN